MESYYTRNKNDEIIKACGEAVFAEFRNFRNDVYRINADIFPLIHLLGMDNTDLEEILKTLIKGINIYSDLKKTFIECNTRKVNAGSIKLEDVLSKRSLAPRDETPERRERRLKGTLSTVLSLKYNNTLKKFFEEYPNASTYYNKTGLKFFGKSLTLTEEGFFIDRNIFLSLYENYWEPTESETYKLHKEAAHAINYFFGTSVPVTKKELERYFVLKNGRVEPNPDSVNKKSYLRLGIKGKVKAKKKR